MSKQTEIVVKTDLLDEEIILQELGAKQKTELVGKLFYHIEYKYTDKHNTPKVSVMEGLSIKGVEFTLQKMIASGQWVEIKDLESTAVFDERENKWKGTARILGVHRNGTRVEMTGDQFYIPTGGAQDRFGEIIAKNKAWRNAWRKLIPESLILELMKQYKEKVHNEVIDEANKPQLANNNNNTSKPTATAAATTATTATTKSTKPWVGKNCEAPDCGKIIDSEVNGKEVDGHYFHPYCWNRVMSI